MALSDKEKRLRSYVLSKVDYNGAAGLTVDDILLEDIYLSGMGRDGVQRILNELELEGLVRADQGYQRGKTGEVYRPTEKGQVAARK